MTVLWERKKKHGKGWWLSPTFRCNVNCDYCAINTHTSQFAKADEQPAEMWIDLINQLAGPIIISGGEPFLYDPLVEVLDGADRLIRINTNAKLVTPEKLVAMNNRGNATLLRITFHRHVWSVEQINAWMKSVRALHLPHVKMSTLTLREGPPKAFDHEYKRIARHYGIEARSDAIVQSRFNWPPPTEAKRVLCHRGNLTLYAPDGKRYPCARHLHAKQFPITEDTTQTTVVCDNYGECAQCDRHGPTKVETYDGDLPAGLYPYKQVE